MTMTLLDLAKSLIENGACLCFHKVALGREHKAQGEWTLMADWYGKIICQTRHGGLATGMPIHGRVLVLRLDENGKVNFVIVYRTYVRLPGGQESNPKIDARINDVRDTSAKEAAELMEECDLNPENYRDLLIKQAREQAAENETHRSDLLVFADTMTLDN